MLWTFHTMFPDAPIFTAMWNRRIVPRFEGCDVRTSWMQRLPGIQRRPRAYAALYPLAFAGLDLRGFKLVISLTTSFAKGVHTDPGSLHVCYCNSPSNFVWRPEAYFRGSVGRLLSAPLRAWLKAWDRRAALKPDVYVTSGRPVADRIRSFYQREAAIVPPAVEGRWFVRHTGSDFFLVVGRLVEQKRVDLAIEASTRLGVPLWIVGEGRAAGRLRRGAASTVRFLGPVSDRQLQDLYVRAIAVVVPAEEDFGIVPLEAQAAGTPVVAYDAGGVRETVIDGVTGIRFAPQTAEALAAAMKEAMRQRWDRSRITANALRFSEGRFREEFMQTIDHYRQAAPLLRKVEVRHRNAV
jgi:glycosyltransferase involved in cell wall biosynthesis